MYEQYELNKERKTIKLKKKTRNPRAEGYNDKTKEFTRKLQQQIQTNKRKKISEFKDKLFEIIQREKREILKM